MAEPQLECDMVMRGGITSGVVYPRAIAHLSKTYRFKQVGGASAGAIAAAAAAACELGRQRTPDDDPFDDLDELPNELGESMTDRLQPHPDLTAPWRLLLRFLRRPPRSPVTTFLRALPTVVRMQPLRVLAAVALGFAALLLLGIAAGGWAWLAGGILLTLAVVVGLLLATLGAVRHVADTIDRNGFGICDGNTKTGEIEPLTVWLTDLFDRYARQPDDAPLTFGDLWGAEASQRYEEAVEKGRHNPPSAAVVRPRNIDLKLMSTNLSQGRPHKLPLDNRNFYWCRACLSAYFPERVLRHMETHSRLAADGVHAAGVPMICSTHRDIDLRTLPLATQLPIVVSVRISASFPVLFSAVPLHTVDFTRRDEGRGPHLVWFADGGITSNFPMHFFDAFWPSRPTLGINLVRKQPDQERFVHRPENARQGVQLRVNPISSTLGLLSTMVRSMQNWADTTLITLPGYRDRVAEVRLLPNEGGLNLTMDDEVIRDLADRGAEAARLFDDFDFDTHQWIRYRVAMAELDEMLGGMYRTWSTDEPAGVALPDKLREPYVPAHYKPISGAWRDRDREATEALIELHERWVELRHPARKQSPKPNPDLRLNPRL